MTLFIQQSHVTVKLSYVGRVHLQIRTFLNKDISQSLMIRPAVVRELPRNKVEKCRDFYYNLDFLKSSIHDIQLLNTHYFASFFKLSPLLSTKHTCYTNKKMTWNSVSIHLAFILFMCVTSGPLSPPVLSAGLYWVHRVGADSITSDSTLSPPPAASRSHESLWQPHPGNPKQKWRC